MKNYHKATSVRTALSEMGNQHPATPVAMYNKSSNRIVNVMAKKKIQSNRHEILLSQRHNTKKLFPHILGRGKEKSSGLCHKTPY